MDHQTVFAEEAALLAAARAHRRFRRPQIVESSPRSEPPAADPDGQSRPRPDVREKSMQDSSHRQQPLLRVVDGEGITTEDLDEEFRRKVAALAEEYAPLLARAKSRWLSFALVMATETGTSAASAKLTRVV